MQKEALIKQCLYYKGEKECPFGGTEQEFDSYKSLKSNPKSFWWHAEKKIVELDIFDQVGNGILCMVKKHMEYCPLSEAECLVSYTNSANLA